MRSATSTTRCSLAGTTHLSPPLWAYGVVLPPKDGERGVGERSDEAGEGILSKRPSDGEDAGGPVPGVEEPLANGVFIIMPAPTAPTNGSMRTETTQPALLRA